MDALDIFEPAGIRFVSVQHEQNAVHMADGYSRVTNKPGKPFFTHFIFIQKELFQPAAQVTRSV